MRLRLRAIGRIVTVLSAAFFNACSCSPKANNNPAPITVVGVHSVLLTWNPSVSSGVRYTVYRRLSYGGPYTVLNSEPIKETEYTDSTVQNGVTYYYAVKAVNGNGVESSFSNEAIAVIPEANQPSAPPRKK